MSTFNRKMGQSDARGSWRLRVFHRQGRGKFSPRVRVKCGDCDAALDIYYGADSMELGGVHASLEEWRALLLPLLRGRAPR